MTPTTAYALTFLLDEAEATRPAGMTDATAVMTLVQDREERGILTRAEADSIRRIVALTLAAPLSRGMLRLTDVLRQQAEETLAPYRPAVR